MPTQPSRITLAKFRALWVVMNGIGWIAALVVNITFFFFLYGGIFAVFLIDEDREPSLLPTALVLIASIILILVGIALSGLLIGSLQDFVLQKVLHRTVGWPCIISCSSVVGFVIVCVFMAIFGWLLDMILRSTRTSYESIIVAYLWVAIAITMPVTGAITGQMQSTAIREFCRRKKWIVASSLGWMLGWVIPVSFLLLVFPYPFSLIGFTLVGLIYGGVTSRALSLKRMAE
jgi:MFS family permease